MNRRLIGDRDPDEVMREEVNYDGKETRFRVGCSPLCLHSISCRMPAESGSRASGATGSRAGSSRAGGASRTSRTKRTRRIGRCDWSDWGDWGRKSQVRARRSNRRYRSDWSGRCRRCDWSGWYRRTKKQVGLQLPYLVEATKKREGNIPSLFLFGAPGRKMQGLLD